MYKDQDLKFVVRNMVDNETDDKLHMNGYKHM